MWRHRHALLALAMAAFASTSFAQSADKETYKFRFACSDHEAAVKINSVHHLLGEDFLKSFQDKLVESGRCGSGAITAEQDKSVPSKPEVRVREFDDALPYYGQSNEEAAGAFARGVKPEPARMFFPYAVQ